MLAAAIQASELPSSGGRRKDRSYHKYCDGQFSMDDYGDNENRNNIASPKLTINVGGHLFVTFERTLRTIPGTRLFYLVNTPVDRLTPDEYDPDTEQYFFDRHPGLFAYVLNYYRTGKLHVPRDICWPLFEQELHFWGIDESHLETCCWMVFRHHRDNQDTLAALDDEDEREHHDYRKDADTPNWLKKMAKVWEAFDDPMSSKMSKLIALLSLTFILVSVAIFCLETHEWFQVRENLASPSKKDLNISTTTPKPKTGRPLGWIFYIETLCVAWFTIEFIVRLITCPNKLSFIKTPLNIVDFLSILPYFFDFVGKAGNQATGVLRVVRICRVFRVFKLTRHSTGLKILWHTLRASMKELVILGVFLCLGVVIFASLVYYAERLFDSNVDTHFIDIPRGFWWAVVTMTTLGYGDMVPKTGMGQVVGAVCALCGLLTIALPVPVIVSNFSLYYSHYQAKSKLPKKRGSLTNSSSSGISHHIGEVEGQEFDGKEAERSLAGSSRRGSTAYSISSSLNRSKIHKDDDVYIEDEVARKSPAKVNSISSQQQSDTSPRSNAELLIALTCPKPHWKQPGNGMNHSPQLGEGTDSSSRVRPGNANIVPANDSAV